MLLFRNLKLIDGVSPDVQEGKAILVEGERIVEVLDERSAPAADHVIHLNGAFVTPGLIDAHVHLISPFVPKITPRVILSLGRQIRRNLRTVVKEGVTTVRDMAAFPRRIQMARRLANQGLIPGPRIVCANSYITCFGGTPEWVPSLRGPARMIAGGQAVERVETPDQAVDAVRRMVLHRADWVKTCHSDRSVCVGKETLPTLSDPAYAALFAEAAKFGKPVAFHQMWLSAFRKGLQFKPATFEHTPFDGLLSDQEVKAFVDAGIALIPTLDVYRDSFEYDRIAHDLEERGNELLEPTPRRLVSFTLEKYKNKRFTREEIEKEWIFDDSFFNQGIPIAFENVGKLWKAGARIGCGTDSGGSNFAFFGFFWRELANLVAAGMSPFEALRSATAVNAQILGLEKDIGTLEPGRLADLVVVEANPLEDIRIMGRVRAVYKGGRLV